MVSTNTVGPTVLCFFCPNKGNSEFKNVGKDAKDIRRKISQLGATSSYNLSTTFSCDLTKVLKDHEF